MIVRITHKEQVLYLEKELQFKIVAYVKEGCQYLVGLAKFNLHSSISKNSTHSIHPKILKFRIYHSQETLKPKISA